MPTRPCLVVAASLIIVVAAAGPAPASAQTGLQRIRPKAFPLTVVPWGGLGFNGTRAVADDPSGGTCSQPTACFEYGLGNGPLLGVDVQLPLPSTFGLQLTAAGTLPNRTRCDRVTGCNTIDHVTMLRGSAVLLIRIKARAPVFLGVGASGSRLDPGTVVPLQDSTIVTEIGGVILLGYDVAMASKVGLRLTLAHYLLRPGTDELAGDFRARSLARDWVFSLGARIRMGS